MPAHTPLPVGALASTKIAWPPKPEPSCCQETPALVERQMPFVVAARMVVGWCGNDFSDVTSPWSAVATHRPSRGRPVSSAADEDPGVLLKMATAGRTSIKTTAPIRPGRSTLRHRAV